MDKENHLYIFFVVFIILIIFITFLSVKLDTSISSNSDKVELHIPQHGIDHGAGILD